MEGDLIYVASPYSHPDPEVRHSRFVAACKHVARLTDAGFCAFSPIAHSHPVVLLGGAPTGLEYWWPLDKHLLSRSDHLQVLMLPGWDQSEGVAREIETAKRYKIEVSYVGAHPHR